MCCSMSSAVMPERSSTLIQSISSEVEGFLRSSLLLAQPVELEQHLVEQALISRLRVVHVDDLLHQLFLGELDEVEDAAPQEGVGQLASRCWM